MFEATEECTYVPLTAAQLTAASQVGFFVNPDIKPLLCGASGRVVCPT